MVARLGIVGLVIACGAVPVAFGGEGAIKSEVLIDDYHQEGNTVIVSGEVESAKHACETQRTVVVIGRDEQAGNAKRVFGSDRTSRRGRYEVLEPIQFQEDWVFAKVRRARLDNGTKCSRDRSTEISTAGRAAHRASDVDTKLKIIASRTNPDMEFPSEWDMNGKITVSPRTDEAKKCARRRKVTVYYRAPAGPLEKGETKTNRRGKWFIAGSNAATSANGEYFAKAPRATRAGLRCSADKSADHVIDYDSLP